MAEQRQTHGIPYVSKVQATAQSRFGVRAPAPILIQQSPSFLFQIDDTDDTDTDVPVEMDLGLGPDKMEEVATAEESCSSILRLLTHVKVSVRCLFKE